MGFPFVGSAYSGRLREASGEVCTNLYLETIESRGSRVPQALIGTPGTMVAFPPFTSGLPRALYPSTNGKLYCVCGNTLYRMLDSESESGIVIGRLSTGYNDVKISDTGRYLTVVDGEVLYVHDMTDDTSGLRTPITGPRPSHIAFLGGWTVINNTYRDPSVSFPPTDNLLYYTPTPYDAMNWSSTSDSEALSFFAAEGKAEPVLSIIRAGDVLWIFTRSSYQVRALSGDDRNPFTRVGGSLSDIGIAAKYSAASMGNKVLFLGSTAHGGLCVYRSNGYDVERISTHAVEHSIGSVDYSDAIGWCYQDEGHDFYVLTMRGSDLTWVWDDTEREWHRRASRVAGTDRETVWEPIYAASIGKTTYVCSNLYPRILKLSLDCYEEWDGRPIKRVRACTDDSGLGRPVRYSRFVLDMSTGVGNLKPGTNGFDPQAILDFSDDGGGEWSNEYWGSIGKRGQRGLEVEFNRLGMARGPRQFRVTIASKSKVVIYGARLDKVDGGRG